MLSRIPCLLMICAICGCSGQGPEDLRELVAGVWQVTFDSANKECVSFRLDGSFVYEEHHYSTEGRPSDQLVSAAVYYGTYELPRDSLVFVTNRRVDYSWYPRLSVPLTHDTSATYVDRAKMTIGPNALTLVFPDQAAPWAYELLSRDVTELSLCGPQP